MLQYLIGQCLTWLPMLKKPNSHEAGGEGLTQALLHVNDRSTTGEQMPQGVRRLRLVSASPAPEENCMPRSMTAIVHANGFKSWGYEA